jgi:hypothetical protein
MKNTSPEDILWNLRKRKHPRSKRETPKAGNRLVHPYDELIPQAITAEAKITLDKILRAFNDTREEDYDRAMAMLK